MNDKLLSLKDIEKSWWWNRKEILRELARKVDWPLVEESARNYELMRRSSKGKQFAKTYLELIPDEKQIVHILWVNWGQAVRREAIRREQYDENGWTPFYETEHRQWNLRVADKKLIDEFIREIRLLREIQKIPAPRRNKGEKHRGVSWKLIEVLERKQSGIGKFNASQRHTLSDAKRRAEKYVAEYERALAKWHEGSSSPDFDIEETDDSNATEQPE
jgi:hypothetical protein